MNPGIHSDTFLISWNSQQWCEPEAINSFVIFELCTQYLSEKTSIFYWKRNFNKKREEFKLEKLEQKYRFFLFHQFVKKRIIFGLVRNCLRIFTWPNYHINRSQIEILHLQTISLKYSIFLNLTMDFLSNLYFVENNWTHYHTLIIMNISFFSIPLCCW